METALKDPNKVVIPVLVDGAAMPTADELPPSLRNLHFRNAATVDNGIPYFENSMGLLAERIQQSLGGRNRWVIWGGVAAILSVIGLGPLLLFGGGGDDDTPANSQVVTEVAAQPSDIATQTETPSPTASATEAPTHTPDVIATVDALNTSIAEAILTENATQWTPTDEPNYEASVQAELDSRATLTMAAQQSKTAVAITPSATATLTDDARALRLAISGVQQNANWQVYSRTFEGIEMVLVPAGCFIMGSNELPEEQPPHGQCIEQPFWIDRTEANQADFAQLAGVKASPNQFEGEALPVESISWFEAAAFCDQRGMRLPTEREWEYAAAGVDSLSYPWGDDWDATKATWAENSAGQTAAVGSLPEGASWVGALDMSGNVWEWTSSIFSGYPYANDGRENPDGRLGAWGFRCAMAFEME